MHLQGLLACPNDQKRKENKFSFYATEWVVTSQNMNIYRNCVSQTWRTRVSARISGFGMLNHKEAGCHITFLGDNADTTTWGIVGNYLQKNTLGYVDWGIYNDEYLLFA